MTSFGRANTTSGANSTSTSIGDLSRDVELQVPPTDSISDIQFRRQSDHLAVASWDRNVWIYDTQAAGHNKCVASFANEGPVFSCCWSEDGQKVFGASADKTVRMLDITTQHVSQVAAHDGPIRCVESFSSNQSPMLVTGSWDKTVKFWDLRQQTPVVTLQCEDRVYSMSVRNDRLLIVGTAERWLQIVDLATPTRFFKTARSPLKWQTRAISAFKDGTGYAVGSTEGRCAFQWIQDSDASKNYSFRCHRQNSTTPGARNTTNVYAVNAISVHPEYGTFSTAGSDGTFHFWDKDSKTRLRGFPEAGGAISATDFNRTGDIFAYAVSYDWSKGYSFNTPQYPSKVMLHPDVGEDCKPRSRTTNR